MWTVAGQAHVLALFSLLVVMQLQHYHHGSWRETSNSREQFIMCILTCSAIVL